MYTSEKDINAFLSEYKRSKVIIETTIRAVLNRALEFEYKFNKPFHLFTTDEALKMFESAHAVSVVSLQNTNLILKNAARWFRHQNGGTIDNAYEHITKDMLETVIDTDKKKSLILDKEDVDDMMDQLLNWTDKCILFLLFNGAGGYMLDELSFLKKEQVSRTDLKVYFRNGKIINISSDDYEMLVKGFEEDELISFGTTSRISKVKSLGIYKARFNSLSDNDNPDNVGDVERRYRWIQRRLMMIGKDLGVTVTSGSLQNSGLLWELKQGVAKTGMTFREFVKTDEALVLAQRYDIFSAFYPQILCSKFEQYFDKED